MTFKSEQNIRRRRFDFNLKSPQQTDVHAEVSGVLRSENEREGRLGLGLCFYMFLESLDIILCV